MAMKSKIYSKNILIKEKMKYKLTKKRKDFLGITLYRIKALKDFGDVKKGDLGGWIEKEANLSQEGSCWVSGNASVSENALVFGDAMVSGNASVSENALVFGDAMVFDNAKVYGYAMVCGDAIVSGDALATKAVINLIGIDYNVTISDNYMQVGYENHPFDYWLNLNKEDILRMGGKEGMKFAKTHKKYLKKLIKNR